MVYARYIGRVGALAVALGVGIAVASTPGIAYAQPSDPGSASSSTDGSSVAAGAASSGESDGTVLSVSDPEQPSGSVDEQSQPVAESEIPADDDASGDAEEAGGAEEGPTGDGDDDAPPAGATRTRRAVIRTMTRHRASQRADATHAPSLSRMSPPTPFGSRPNCPPIRDQMQTLSVDPVTDVPMRIPWRHPLRQVCSRRCLSPWRPPCCRHWT